jgi:hypothetical protein
MLVVVFNFFFDAVKLHTPAALLQMQGLVCTGFGANGSLRGEQLKKMNF